MKEARDTGAGYLLRNMVKHPDCLDPQTGEYVVGYEFSGKSSPFLSPQNREGLNGLLDNEKIRHLFGPDAAYNLNPLDKPAVMPPPANKPFSRYHGSYLFCGGEAYFFTLKIVEAKRVP